MEKQLDRDSAKNLNFFIILFQRQQSTTREVQHPKHNQQQQLIQFNLLLNFLLTIA